MSERLPHAGPSMRAQYAAWTGRMPGPLGCLVAIVLCPVGLVLGVVLGVSWIASALFGRRRTGVAAASSPRAPAAAPREAALCRLVRALAMDDTFTVEDARQAGTLDAGGATVDDLLREAQARRWIEFRGGDRFAVTERGRGESERRLRDGLPGN